MHAGGRGSCCRRVSCFCELCFGGRSSNDDGSNGTARLDRALHAWAGFPARSSPRPLILLEGEVLNPGNGFPDETSKEAFGNGQITVPAGGWPESPNRSMGFPIIGAAAAFKTLTTPGSNALGSPPPLGTTAVQLGSGLFLTDRGWRTLPAWLFSLTGVQNPAEVLAGRAVGHLPRAGHRSRSPPGAAVRDRLTRWSAHRGEFWRCSGGRRSVHGELQPLDQRVQAGCRGCGECPPAPSTAGSG